MKITTQVPTPVPITWTLVLTDDEMADLIGGLRSSVSRYAARTLRSIADGGVSTDTFSRLLQRNRERCGDNAGLGGTGI